MIMKKLGIGGFVIILIIMLLLLTGCGSSEQDNLSTSNAIVGRWQGELMITADAGNKTYEEEYVFNDDGTYQYITETYPQERTSKYKIEGDQLTMWQFDNAKDTYTTWTVKYNQEGYDIELISNDDTQIIFKGNKGEF